MRIKIIRSIFASLLLVVIFAGVSRSQTGSSAVDTLGRRDIGNIIYGLGLNFSPVSGFGVSTRAHFAPRFSAMITGFVSKTSDETFYNYGLELQYDLMVRERARLYLLAGASHYYDQYNDYSSINSQPRTDHLGLGFGLELNFHDDDFCIDGSLELTSFQPSGDLIIYPAVGTHYYFR